MASLNTKQELVQTLCNSAGKMDMNVKNKVQEYVNWKCKQPLVKPPPKATKVSTVGYRSDKTALGPSNHLSVMPVFRRN